MTQVTGFQSDEIDESDLFMQLPALYADPARLVPCFGGGITLETSVQLLATKRMGKRLSMLLSDHYQLPEPPSDDEEPVEEVDKPVAFASREELADIAVKAGAVYWAATLARTISGREATVLRNQLGAELCALAMANKDLSGPEQLPGTVETLRSRVEADGWRCLVAWCYAVGPAVAARIRLKLTPQNPLEEPLDQSFETTGPSIIRRIAQ